MLNLPLFHLLQSLERLTWNKEIKSTRFWVMRLYCLPECHSEHVFSWDGTHVYHIKPCLCRKGYSQKSISPPRICIPLILPYIDWAPGMWIYFNTGSVTLDSNEAHYSVEKIRKYVCKSMDTDTHPHTNICTPCRNTSHLPHCFPSRDWGHTARCAITPLPRLCIYHSETNALLVL